MKQIIIVIVFVFCVWQSFAQSECDNIVERASDLYNSGRYDDCVSLLEANMSKCHLSKSKKEKAYVLLVNSYIEKDSTAAIDKNFKLLLLNNPAFKIKDYVGIDDFKTSYRNYYTLPRLTIGLRVAYYMNDVRLSKLGKEYAVTPNIYNNSDYKTYNAFNVSFVSEIRPTTKIGLLAECAAYKLSYERFVENDVWKLTTAENINYIQLDLGAKYYLNHKSKLNFNVSAGFNNLYLLGSSLNLIVVDSILINDYNSNPSFTSYKDAEARFDSKNIRSNVVSSFFVGAGFIYKFGNTGVGFDYRTMLSLNTINNQKKRVSEPSLIERFGYIDNDMALRKKTVSIVFVYMFNQVREKKKRNSIEININQ
jgi:hypothetical protein